MMETDGKIADCKTSELKEHAKESNQKKRKLHHSGPMQYQAEVCGIYIIIRYAVVKNGENNTESKKVAQLSPGTLVNVLEVRHVPKIRRLRGRIEEPRGWISLTDLESDVKWAVKSNEVVKLVYASSSGLIQNNQEATDVNNLRRELLRGDLSQVWSKDKIRLLIPPDGRAWNEIQDELLEKGEIPIVLMQEEYVWAKPETLSNRIQAACGYPAAGDQVTPAAKQYLKAERGHYKCNILQDCLRFGHIRDMDTSRCREQQQLFAKEEGRNSSAWPGLGHWFY